MPALAPLVADDNGDVRITALAALGCYKFDALGPPQGGQPGGEGGRRADAAVGGECPGRNRVPTDGAQTTELADRSAVAEGVVRCRPPCRSRRKLARFGKPDEEAAAALRTALGGQRRRGAARPARALLGEE